MQFKIANKFKDIGIKNLTYHFFGNKQVDGYMEESNRNKYLMIVLLMKVHTHLKSMKNYRPK